MKVSYFDEETGVDLASVRVLFDGADVTAGCTVNNRTAWCQQGELASGLHRIDVSVADRHANVATAEHAFRVDLQPPALTVTEPANDAYLNSNEVVVAGTVSDDVGASVRVSGEPATVVDGAFSHTLTLEEGGYGFSVSATDGLGRSVYVHLRVTVDTAPPVIEVREPRAGAITNRATVTVEGTASGHGSDIVSVRVAGTEATRKYLTRFTAEVALAEGVNQILVTATDEAGNVASETIEITRLSPPKVSITSPISGSLVSAATVDVTGTVAPAGTPVTVAGVAAAVDGESWLAVGVPVGEGMTILTALATDAAGGLTGAASVSLARDATPPRIAIELPIDGARVGAAAVSVAGLVNDLVAGSATGTDATVTVAGVPAQVRNRSFLAEGVPLAPGENLLEAVAVDAGGNVGRATVRVVRGAPEGPHLAAVGGDGQSAGVRLFWNRQKTACFQWDRAICR